MKSDLTCPVEIVNVKISRDKAHTNESGPIVCLIDFFNLSEKTVDSIQMNLICFNAQAERIGGRLVRAGAHGEARERFSGVFMPEHVEEVSRVEASVEKVWFQDGVIWRREERNVREYTPNTLAPGRELDRLRAVAGADANGYAREEDTVWLCVCGRANRTSDDRCMRCERERATVLREYSFAAIDSTVGRKERMLEERTRENLRKSSEQTVRQLSQEQMRLCQRRRRLYGVAGALFALAVLLVLARWGVPMAAMRYAQSRLDKGLAADAKTTYAFVESYWPGLFDAQAGEDAAERIIVSGLIDIGTDSALSQAADRARTLGDASLEERAVIARARLAMQANARDTAEELLLSLHGSAQAVELLHELVYAIAEDAMDQLDYPTAIARFASLGDYEDAMAMREECIYMYGRQLMRAGRYEEASEQLMQVSGYNDAIALIRQCRYTLAQQRQEQGEYIQAAQLYESLGVYEEAETRARVCRYTAGINALSGGDLPLAAEQLKMAEGYEDAAARFEEVAFTLGNAALSEGSYQDAIGWLEQITRTDEVAAAFNVAVYAYAQELEADGQIDAAIIEYASLGEYEDALEHAHALEYDLALAEMRTAPQEAYARFEGLGNYRDAREQATACRYIVAQQAAQSGDYEAAIAGFEALGDHSDAAAQAQRSRYNLANRRMDEGRYDEAAALYEACGAYLDAEDGVQRAHYAAAQALFDAGEYEQAANAFEALGSYEDSKLRVTASEDAWLQDSYVQARLDMDLEDYASVITTLADIWQSDLPARYADIATMYEQACLSRSQELIAMNRPLDALPLLESIGDNRTARNRLDAYVYQIIGRWKDTRGTEYIFRRDGSCRIADEEGYFGGSGYEITVGSEPYPTSGAYSVVSLRNSTLTLRDQATDRTVRLSYLGEPTQPPEEAQDESAGQDEGEAE